MKNIFSKAFSHFSIGSIKVGLPKEAISGKVPAWAVLTVVAGLGAGRLLVSYLNNKRECETREKTTGTNTGSPASSQESPQNANDTSSTANEQPQSPNDDIPEWVDAASVEDKELDSNLLGQSGALVLVKAREGSGKTTLVNQLLVEACEGKSSHLFLDNEGVCGPQWKSIPLRI
jgi:hypothetical protein|nr:MAG TPA: ATPase [Bacteriophage sp.]